MRRLLYVAALCTAFGSAIAKPPIEYLPIDLHTAANMAFADEQANDHKGGWTDQGPVNDMKGMPLGRQVWDGTPFEIIDPRTNNGAGCIVLRGKPRSWLPLETPSIPVNTKGDAILFAGVCAWPAGHGEEVLRLVVTYVEDIRYSESAFAYGRHFSDWWNAENAPLGDLVYEHFNGANRVGLYRFGWVNPYPDKTIASIKLISADTSTVPIIVAATLVKPGPAATDLVMSMRQQEEAASKTQEAASHALVTIDWTRALRPIPTALVSVANGSSTAPIYNAASQRLLSEGCNNASTDGRTQSLPPRPFYRIQTHMAEPSLADGVWDFTQLDRIIDAAISFGAEPMICISFPPSWFFSPAPTHAEAMRLRKPFDLDAYAEHCARLVQHYMIGKYQNKPVLWWEIGNEVELHDWSSNYYLKVYQTVSERLRKLSPRLRLGGPVTAGPNPAWAEELLRNASGSVDFLAYHQYGYSEPFDTPDSYIMSRTPLYRTTAERYSKIIREQAPQKPIPLIITETNSSWRYHEGTDPRIRTPFGAAWTASVIGQFLAGGGDAICYFTLNGGFGSMWEEKGKVVIYPVWHSLWLYRKFFHGELIASTSDVETIEAYAWRNEKERGFFLINKNSHPVEVSVDTGTPPAQAEKQALTFELTAETASQAKEVDSVNGAVPLLSPGKISWPDKTLELTLKPLEVRVVVLREVQP